jgi:energy-coupling factor transporter transmembrane protein EcfT
MPAVVRMIIMQILYQTGTLQNETVRMAQALKVRNISTTIALRRSLIFKWPAAWLLRVLVRAERVSNAMEIRDYSCFIAKNYALITTKIDIVFMFVLLFVCILTGIGRIYG